MNRSHRHVPIVIAAVSTTLLSLSTMAAVNGIQVQCHDGQTFVTCLISLHVASASCWGGSSRVIAARAPVFDCGI